MNTLPATKKDVETAVEQAVDKLADMIGKGFEHHDKRFTKIEDRLDGMDSRLGRIENLLLAEHKQEIEDLKKRMKRLEDALAV